jgi:serine/threonine protein kinase
MNSSGAGRILQNRYHLQSLLGRGGMGAVYRAWDARLEVPVAVKEMVPQPGLDPQTLAHLRGQFRQEALTLARLNHPHLVRVTDFFEEGGNAYLVMDLVQGQSLADLIAARGPLPEDQVLEWTRQLLDALAYCHSQGVIHRDIKPQNVIIRPDGKAVLVDFGLVKLWDPRDPRTRTALRGMGTPEYAPPEQYDATGHTDPRSDLYSLGSTLYHALTGQAPPTATARIAHPESFRPLRALAPGVSPRTEAAVMRALELPAGARWPDAAEMARALFGPAPLSATVSPGPAASAGAAPRPRPAGPGAAPRRGLPSSRKRVLLALAAALAVVLCGLAAVLAWTAYGNRGGGGPGATATPAPVRTATVLPGPGVQATATPTREPVRPTSTPSPVPTLTSTRRPTSTPVPTPTSTPTRRPPTPTFTPTPTEPPPPPPPPPPPGGEQPPGGGEKPPPPPPPSSRP